ncbi:MAG: methyl-accepting chemotaxis protein [Myxococcota bacterium]
MNLKMRLYLSSTVPTVLLAVLMVMVIARGAQTSRHIAELETGFVPATELTRELQVDLASIRLVFLEAAARRDAAMITGVDPILARMVAALEKGRSNPVLDQQGLAPLVERLRAWVAHGKTTIARIIVNDPTVGADVELMRKQSAELDELISKGVLDVQRRSQQSFEALRENHAGGQTTTIIISLVVVVFLAGLVVRLSTRLSGPLTKLTKLAEAVAAGDLSQDPHIAGTELGSLTGAFEQMVLQLRSVLRSIDGLSKQVLASASQIHAAVREQEAASQTQSTGAEEVNRTMQSLLESATHIASSAAGVATNANRTRETALGMTSKIGELATHANRMSEILEVIREIAERSDLLALNASLEGTRAGEAGRGFSLVANEMRRLSERVSESVRDVKGLVSDIRASAASTVMVTEEARTLAENTAASAQQITFVTEQQRTATEQISASMKEVTAVLGDAVKANGQTRDVATTLSSHAQELAGLTARFKMPAT